MNQQKNQDAGGLLGGIQDEVSPESAPLLQFITKYAGTIAAFVVLLLLIIGAVAIWDWYHNSKQEEARAEMARISYQLKGQERDAALAKLAESAPESVKLYIYLSLARSAQENGNPALAADAYAAVAKLDGDGPLGITAALGSAACLLMQARYEEALGQLQELEKKVPDQAVNIEIRQLLAEAAAKAGRPDLAQAAYQKLAQEIKSSEGQYFQFRAGEMAKKMAAEKKVE